MVGTLDGHAGLAIHEPGDAFADGEVEVEEAGGMSEGEGGAAGSWVRRFQRLVARHPVSLRIAEGVLLGGLAWALLGWQSGLLWLIGWPLVRGGFERYRARRQTARVTVVRLSSDRGSREPETGAS